MFQTSSIKYVPHDAERKWQKKWDEAGLYKAEIEPGKPKFYIHFAYPGISGYLHVGHMRGFTYTDVFTRYKRMRGFNVLFPVGSHATGNQAISFAKKVSEGNEAWIEYLRANKCPEEQIRKMKDPGEVVAYFNKIYTDEYWKKFGFLADWRRFTCTIWPDYGKFIEWQFKKLNDHGYLTQKPYFATFCPSCGPVAVDPSETDLHKGGKAEKHEYTLLKFKFGDSYLLAATLRPETVFGQTNFWVDPELDYVKVKIEGETWIVSQPCADKLQVQKDGVEILEKVRGREIIGKTATAPVVERPIPILPANFCDPNVGTGMVTSVPSDAPYDWMALVDIKKNDELKREYDLESLLESLEPIPIIDTKNLGDLPAIKICEEMGIENQDDPKLEEATKIIYKSGFHTGRMKENCGDYAGLPVEEAKDRVKEDMIAQGIADVLHDLSEEVVCRCGDHVLVKRIDDQWFIRYSDTDWTEKTKDFAEGMNIHPQPYYDNFPGILDWFQDRACARLGNWLGTNFPLDRKWIIEPISDSTIYPSYYIISKFVNEGLLNADSLTEKFFDFVFLGQGKSIEVAEQTGVEKDLLEKIREEFTYWYPVDINLGGKEHQTVHFPVYAMNHVAVFPGTCWPRGIFVNWWIIQKGGIAKISKSKGGAEPVPDAIQKFTVDGLRLYYCHVASPFVDVEWDEQIVHNYRQRIQKIWSLVHGLTTAGAGQDGPGEIEHWLISRMNRHLENVNSSLDEFDVKSASHVPFFGMVTDLEWYLKRGGGKPEVLGQYLEVLVKVLAPFTPHLAEELWEAMGRDSFVSTAEFPGYEPEKINLVAELGEEYLRWTIDDIQSIIKVIKKDPGEILLYTAPSWKIKAWKGILEAGDAPDVKAVMKKLMADDEMRRVGKEVSRYLTKAVQDIRTVPTEFKGIEIDEMKLLASAREFLEKRFQCSVKIHSGDDPGAPDPHRKKGQAAPLRPAISVD
jgi:leucyl-tRNA synthetase